MKTRKQIAKEISDAEASIEEIKLEHQNELTAAEKKVEDLKAQKIEINEEIENLKNQISFLKKKNKDEESVELNNLDILKKIENAIKDANSQIEELKLKIASGFKVKTPYWDYEGEEYSKILTEQAKLKLESVRENILNLHKTKESILKQNEDIRKERSEFPNKLKELKNELNKMEEH